MSSRPSRTRRSAGVPAWSGRPYPLGADFDGQGTNFALFSEAAERSNCASWTTTGPSEAGCR